MPRPWIPRLVALIVLGAFILLTPAFAQIGFLRIENETLRPFVHSWQMYAGYGRNSCDVRVRAKVDGKWRRVDHTKLLHGRSWIELSPRKRRTYRDDIERVGAQVCRSLNTDDVRIVATCGTRRGWRRRGDPKKNHCPRSD